MKLNFPINKEFLTCSLDGKFIALRSEGNLIKIDKNLD